MNSPLFASEPFMEKLYKLILKQPINIPNWPTIKVPKVSCMKNANLQLKKSYQ